MHTLYLWNKRHQLFFRHVTQFLRGCYSRDSTTQLRRYGGNCGEKTPFFKRRFLAQMVSDLSAILMSGWAFVCSMLVWCLFLCLSFRFRKFRPWPHYPRKIWEDVKCSLFALRGKIFSVIQSPVILDLLCLRKNRPWKSYDYRNVIFFERPPF